MNFVRPAPVLLLLALLLGCEHATTTNEIKIEEIRYGIIGIGAWDEDHWNVNFILYDSLPSVRLTSVQRGTMKVNQLTFDLSSYIPFPAPGGRYEMPPDTPELTISMHDASMVEYAGSSDVPESLPDPEHDDASRLEGLTFFFMPPTSATSPVEVTVWTTMSGSWIPQYKKVYSEAGLTAAHIPASVVRQNETDGRLRVSFNRTQHVTENSTFPAGFTMYWQRTNYNAFVKVVP